MKKINSLITAFFLAALISVNAQEPMGKMASLNDDGTISVTSVPLSSFSNTQESLLPADLMFSFGKPANPQIKNSRGVTLADVNNDGTEEIIYGINTTLYVLNGDGTVLFEKAVEGPILLPPTVVDLNDDGTVEIIINTGYPTTVGRVYLTDNEGNDLPGWPLNFENKWMINAPAVADVDGNGTLDIVTGERFGSTQGFVHALNMDGTEINDGWPVEIPATPAFTPSIGDVDNDGSNDVVIAASSGGMYVFNSDGEVLDGFPVVDPAVKYSYQSPILANVDDDDELEIIGSNHGDAAAFYVMNHDGTYADGWPIARPGWTFSPATVLDIDGDDVFEIFMSDRDSSTDGSDLPTVYGLTPEGENIANFPIEKYGGTEGVLSIADINNDDVLDIIFPSTLTDAEGLGFIHAYAMDGSGELDGFPLRPYGFTFLNGAVLGDVDNDGMLDLTANTYTLNFGADVDSTFVNTYNLNVPYNADKILRNGYKGNNTRDGLVTLDVTLATPDFSEAISLSISPNPSEGILRLELPISIEAADVKIFSIDGKVVFSETTSLTENTNRQFDLRNLKSGLYLVNVSDGKNNYTGKWIKQ
ncbi:T9SS type A sorting domain-containing protein [Cochleicola gelatinilyticus]|uniref:Secretion system C-terminal sorting domain-containing protein n=1 Tax=Cochleicola gelatinilyticus TaxID=1763537 RepID=A0A167KBH5_9FLAO|nr:T9SS type A sorting domain-containing protein [Cochleicola gelatinilyticus]OAB81693.1 hypothetical protein ULVI_00775 [Cochleicola gelatinilyticus]